MTYRYISMAVGRIPRYRGIYDVVAYDKHGRKFPPMTETEEMVRLWTRKVIDYTVKGSVLHARLDVESTASLVV